jgi:hypothetical protein
LKGEEMPKRNQFKYMCGDCGYETWLSAGERNSKFRPRCIACGGVHLDPVKGSEAKQRLPEIHYARKRQIELNEEKQNIK